MPSKYRIHPGIGIARLGNSPDAFCITPETPATLPLDCDDCGNPLLSSDGMTELAAKSFKDAEGRLKRQAARFQVWAYDDEDPEGRPLKLGDEIEGGGNAGTLINIEWRVYLANKKASWYEFKQLEGEHGYDSSHTLRNAALTEKNARQQLIIDPGPRTVDHRNERRAQFNRDGAGEYATIFPPSPLKPNSIDTLGDLLTDDTGRLLVLGGHGNSGSYLYDDFGQPRIDSYANNDGWFDDTSDGPVFARLSMYSPLVKQVRFIDVEYPAWVVCCYPAYVPEILDVVTMDDVIDDMAIRKFAERTDLFGESDTFEDPQRISPTDKASLIHWRSGNLRWNPDYKPWFYRDVWNILFRPDQYSYLCDVLSQSNYPHNYSTRGTFDPDKLGTPPVIDRKALKACEEKLIREFNSGALFVNELAGKLVHLETTAAGESLKPDSRHRNLLTRQRADRLRKALKSFARTMPDPTTDTSFDEYLEQWSTAAETAPAKEKLKSDVDRVLGDDPTYPEDVGKQLSKRVHKHLKKYLTGQLLREAREFCLVACTYDPYGAMRRYLFDLLRAPGEENKFKINDKPDSRVHNLPLMPLLCGDNPITNELPSKFFRLTDYQYYVLRQWARGLFYNEKYEGWADPDPFNPCKGWANRTGRDLDRGVISNILGGSFCPGAEIGWVMRNPSVWIEPYRLKADPAFYTFGQTAGQANFSGTIPDRDFAFYAGSDLSQANDFETGLQPGDFTKYMSVPWQADFNECSTQPIDVTYERFNRIYPNSDNDKLMKREQKVWETLWWPAHRPLQTFVEITGDDGRPAYVWRDWTPGIPQTKAGDLKMVTEWWRLGVVKRNPEGDFDPTTSPPPSPPPYISVERTETPTTHKKE